MICDECQKPIPPDVGMVREAGRRLDWYCWVAWRKAHGRWKEAP